jgi:hypothetical protein
VRRARLAPAMISMPGHRAPRRRQRGALPAWLQSGAKREPGRFETILSAPLFRDGSGSRPRPLVPGFRFQLGFTFVG